MQTIKKIGRTDYRVGWLAFGIVIRLLLYVSLLYNC